MTSSMRNPTRWKELQASDREPQRVVGFLVRSMGQAPRLSERQLAQISDRLEHGPCPLRLLRWLPAALVILLASSLVMAAHLGWIRSLLWKRTPEPSIRALSTKSPTKRESGHMTAAPLPVAQPVSEPQLNTSSSGVSVPQPRARESKETVRVSASERSVRKSREPIQGPVPYNTVRAPVQPQPRDLAALGKSSVTAPVTDKQAPVAMQPALRPQEETASQARASREAAQAPDSARWLAEAIRTLRKDRAPEKALAILERHTLELSQDGMSLERILVQVEAMLALRQSAEVLRLLDVMPSSEMTGSRVLLLTRAELRATAGRCADGIGDFDLVLARAGHPDERALYGRAVCRLRTGDNVGARRDFEHYQELFPQGSHLSEVKRHLDQ